MDATTPHDRSADEAQPMTRAQARGGASAAGRARRPAQEGGWWNALRETILVAAIALGISLLVKTFLAQMFWIPSESMQNTLQVKDRVVVSKLSPSPFDIDRGDVVVFSDTQGWMPPTTADDESPLKRAAEFVGLVPGGGDSHLIKRVIGLPGDHVVCCDAQGRVSVNDQPLDETYLHPGDKPSEMTFDIVVPENKLWVMGDHRSDSGDSRYHDNGTNGVDGSVPRDSVTGRAEWVVWPLNHAQTLDDGGVFDKVPAPTR